MKGVDVLAIIDKVAAFNGGLIADDLEKVEKALEDLISTGRSLSADLEHALAIATFNGANVSGTPLRASLDAFDAALAKVTGATDGR